MTASCWASFSPKKARSGATIVEQLGDDRGDAVEVAGARRAFEGLGERAADVHDGREALGVHLVCAGREHDVHAGVREQVEVALLVARVALEVLAGAELRGVDEDGGGDRGAALAGGRARATGGPRAARPWWARGRGGAAARRARPAPR